MKQYLLLAVESRAVYPVTLKRVNSLSFSSQKSKIGFLKTALGNFVKRNESATCKLPIKCAIVWLLDLEVDLCLL